MYIYLICEAVLLISFDLNTHHIRLPGHAWQMLIIAVKQNKDVILIKHTYISISL